MNHEKMKTLLKYQKSLVGTLVRHGILTICFLAASSLLFLQLAIWGWAEEIDKSILEQPIKIPTATITVDAAQIKGALPDAYKIGTLLNAHQAFSKNRYFTDIKPGGNVRMDVGWTFFYNTPTYEDFLEKLSHYDNRVKDYIEQGAQPLVNLSITPEFLVSNPDKTPVDPNQPNGWLMYHTAPPEDWDLWSQVVGDIVGHFKNELGVDLLYEIWNEPDLKIFWSGTEEEYFQLYKYACLGAQEADSEVIIGGPVVSFWDNVFQAPKGEPEDSMLYKWIKYSSENNLPIGFVTFHMYGVENKSYMKNMAETIKGWLVDFGYDSQTPLGIDEWNTWGQGSKFDERRDMNFLASYGVKVLKGMAEAGIDQHCFFIFQDSKNRRDEDGNLIKDPFIGDFGMLTKEGITKSVFNGFQLISKLDSTELLTKQKPDWDFSLFSIATTNTESDKFSLVIVNYPASPIYVTLAYLNHLGYSQEYLETLVIPVNAELFKAIIKGKIRIEKLPLPEEVKEDLKEATRVYQIAGLSLEHPRPIKIKLTNSSFEKNHVIYKRYLIDSQHSNSYYVKDKIEEALTSIEETANNIATFFLVDKGYDKEEAESLVQLHARNPEEALKQVNEFPEEKKEHFLSAFALRDRLAEKGSAAQVREINRWPEVALAKVEEKVIRPDDIYGEKIELEPYSVTLLELEAPQNLNVIEEGEEDLFK